MAVITRQSGRWGRRQLDCHEECRRSRQEHRTSCRLGLMHFHMHSTADTAPLVCRTAAALPPPCMHAGLHVRHGGGAPCLSEGLHWPRPAQRRRRGRGAGQARPGCGRVRHCHIGGQPVPACHHQQHGERRPHACMHACMRCMCRWRTGTMQPKRSPAARLLMWVIMRGCVSILSHGHGRRAWLGERACVSPSLVTTSSPGAGPACLPACLPAWFHAAAGSLDARDAGAAADAVDDV